jgi:hypothetical protein
MAKGKKVSSLIPDEQETRKRLGSKLPSELTRQDRGAKVPAGVSVDTGAKVPSLSKGVTEEYYNSKGESQLRGSSSIFTKKS